MLSILLQHLTKAYDPHLTMNFESIEQRAAIKFLHKGCMPKKIYEQLFCVYGLHVLCYSQVVII